VKTTLEIHALLERAKRSARRVARSLRAIVSKRSAQPAYELPDASVGDPSETDPLEALSWQDLRDEIHGQPSSR
jgi:hypothetical protein